MRFCLAYLLLFAVRSAFTLTAVRLDMPQGPVIGYQSEEAPAVSVFKGIPYANPPIGIRRWTYAEAATGWDSPRLTQQFGPNCVQAPYPKDSFFFRPSFPTSEDCLYLNVWTAAKNPEEKRPVMVWIHGGALTRGGGSVASYDGTALAQKGVVLVTINYRLGIFGYFAHPELSAESPHGVSGNYGTSDQIQALRWVRDNIAAFGGDPGNVTIFGQSAGSWSVNHLMASPQAAGLFHRAIGESGAAMRTMAELKQARGRLDSAHASGEKFAQAIGASSLPALRAFTAEDLLVQSSRQRWQTAAIVDGRIIPAQIIDIFKDGKQNAVPVIVGFNSEEGTSLGALARVPSDPEDYEQGVRSFYGSLADEYLQLYPSSQLIRSTLDSYRDRFFTWPMQTWAMLMAEVNQPAYLYYFTHRPARPQKQALGAFHGAEVRYAFNNVADGPDYEKKMAAIMSDYWVNFAKTGNPNGKGLTSWQPYTAAKRHYLELNAETKAGAIAGNNPLPGVWEFYQKLNTAH